MVNMRFSTAISRLIVAGRMRLFEYFDFACCERRTRYGGRPGLPTGGSGPLRVLLREVLELQSPALPADQELPFRHLAEALREHPLGLTLVRRDALAPLVAFLIDELDPVVRVLPIGPAKHVRHGHSCQ
jgi:hypothetical protein